MTTRDLASSIKLIKQQMDASIFRQNILENELAYPKEALKNLEQTAQKRSLECRNLKEDYKQGLQQSQQ